MLVTLEGVEKVKESIGAVCSLQCSALTMEGVHDVFDRAIHAVLNQEENKEENQEENKE